MAGDDNPARSLISRLFSREPFNPDWKNRQGKSKCPSRKGKTDTSVAEDGRTSEQNTKDGRTSEANTKDGKTSEQHTTDARTSEANTKDGRTSESNTKDSDKENYASSPSGPTHMPSSKNRPPRENCCYIKMQDPKAPCCRDHTTDLPPCPSRQHHPEPREPICECDRCKTRGGRCCRNGYSRSNVDPRCFQQA